MKIAIFNNYLDNIGGAEMVTLFLARELKADIYTTNINPEKIVLMGFGDVLPRIHSLGRIPTKAPFRQQLAFWKFRKLNLSGQYDFFIIAGDWAMSGAVNNRPNLWYVHSPLNELWEFKNFVKTNLLNRWQGSPYDLWVWYNRQLSLKYARSVDVWVANSENTRRRIKKFYGPEATVINPPVDTSKYSWHAPKNYWLSVNRLAVHKRVELQVAAFRNLPDENLIIIGSYEPGVPQFENCKKNLEQTKTANVTIKHWVGDEELIKLYAECRGFITTSQDEDFGMNAIEAMAAGKPVIAPNEGGYQESVIDGATGILINEINPEKLAETIKTVGAKLAAEPEVYKTRAQARAREFDVKKFMEKIKAEIEQA